MKLVDRIVLAAQAACVLEVSAPKPGNVNRQYDFEDAHFEDFLLSAIAIRPALQAVDRDTIGSMIRRAIQDTHRLVKTNTNLGIVLLLAPLAKACYEAQKSDLAAIRDALAGLLDDLSRQDAHQAYAAIRLANAGGLGTNVEADVAEEPEITLLQAMALAQERDAIAREYVTRFAITFEIGFPAIESAWKKSTNLPLAIVQAYLTILAQVPDTLIARKRNVEAAYSLSLQAAKILERGGVFSESGKQAVEAMDKQLRLHGHQLNPGTTADLTTASLFLFLFLRSGSRDPIWPLTFNHELNF